MARVPMRVVYWGRWADAAGNVGPFSVTAIGWIEGGSHHLMGAPRPGAWKAPPVLEDARVPGPAGQDRTYIVAVLDAQFQSMQPQRMMEALPDETREPRQLEGPAASEAA